ncbi:MAG TPA: winged helix-turn-helix domain-containing protein [Thermoplasmata archaeon]|nr:winged helix-turn-helix domain-containing protein [Thermoplasmata archaeon]
MDPGAPKITLDQESFKALASDVRVGILKRLDVRRETVTDLSNLLELSKPTLLEHLEKLQTAGLVKRIDEGRKWIYYELSDKGRKILHPERVAITLALSAAVVLATIGALYVVFSASVFGSYGLLRNETATPAASQTALGGVGLVILPFVLSAFCGLLALGLRVYGGRRRERFFERLGIT